MGANNLGQFEPQALSHEPPPPHQALRHRRQGNEARDLRQLHRYLIEMHAISTISDETRAVVESEWPELARKILPPKEPHG